MVYHYYSLIFIVPMSFNQHFIFCSNYYHHLMILYLIFYLVQVKYFEHPTNFKVLELSYLMSDCFIKFSFENLFIENFGKQYFDLDLEYYFGINL